MFKGMKKGLLCLVLALILIAPMAHAGTWDVEVSPLTTISQLVRDLADGIQQSLSNAWVAVFANDETEGEVEEDEEPLPLAPLAAGDPAPVTAEDDDDGNAGPGFDPFG